MQQVFVYGSLLFSEVVQALTGTSFPTQEAILHNFKRLAVSEADYPAVFPSKGSKVKGKLLQNVDRRSLEILKFYEGDEYECISTAIHVKNKRTEALVFVWKGDAKLLNGNWDEKQFQETSLETYIQEIATETLLAFEVWQAKTFNQA
ncbi:gamma-glutamylcyclotransferase [Maribellus sp. CM-23]|uniref:gamma-glutamylcyclotransferase family protein n=1 Tax=Maribellus sp. CM-23 TaxID=2781026 RepID=UPI001F3B9725|nr:gamma-glutamylcyclotransferase family protein [Maribellus sp. CM-23]MCE4565989.1 gamma-glutamylcyclotransferase [Maribellus sp. CM-23]